MPSETLTPQTADALDRRTADGPDATGEITDVILVAEPAPVFVDSTGRRRRLLRRTSYGFAAFCVVYGGLVSASLTGGPVSPNAILPFPDLIDQPRSAPTPGPPPGGTGATAVAGEPRAAERVRPASRPPTAGPTGSPGPPRGALDAAGRTPAPDAPTPEATAGPGRTSPTPDRTTPGPDRTPTAAPTLDPPPTREPAPNPEPTPTPTPEPTPTPTDIPTGDGGGVDGDGTGMDIPTRGADEPSPDADLEPDGDISQTGVDGGASAASTCDSGGADDRGDSGDRADDRGDRADDRDAAAGDRDAAAGDRDAAAGDAADGCGDAADGGDLLRGPAAAAARLAAIAAGRVPDVMSALDTARVDDARVARARP